MRTTTLPRIQARRAKHDSGFTLRLLLVSPLLLAAHIVLALFGEDTPRSKFSGNVGTDESLKSYGKLTIAEHDEIAAWRSE